jgi:hypothetical protein
MRERNAMTRKAWLAAIVLVAFVAPACAAPAADERPAPSRVKQRPPQIRVTPLYPHATTNTPYPRPYTYAYPGPNAHRECVGRLVVEARPSGTVIVPRQHCWWARGPGSF